MRAGTGIHIPDKEAFAARMLRERTRRGLSQRELAFPGCSAVYISRIERGQRFPSIQVVQGLAGKLGVSAHYLLTGKQNDLATVALKVVAEHRSGVEIPDRLIAALEQKALEAIPEGD